MYFIMDQPQSTVGLTNKARLPNKSRVITIIHVPMRQNRKGLSFTNNNTLHDMRG